MRPPHGLILNGPILYPSAEASAAAKTPGDTCLDAILWSTKRQTPRMCGTQEQPRPPPLLVVLVTPVASVFQRVDFGFALAFPTTPLSPSRAASLLEPSP